MFTLTIMNFVRLLEYELRFFIPIRLFPNSFRLKTIEI